MQATHRPPRHLCTLISAPYFRHSHSAEPIAMPPIRHARFPEDAAEVLDEFKQAQALYEALGFADADPVAP